MPNRILKESIWRSPNLNKCDRLTCEFFFRLLPAADDYGCFEADPMILHAKLYPRCMNMLSCADICRHMLSLVDVGILMLWCDNNSLWGNFVSFSNHNRIRAKHKRKTPPEKKEMFNNQEVIDYLSVYDSTCCHMTAHDRLNPNPNPNPNPKNTIVPSSKKTKLDIEAEKVLENYNSLLIEKGILKKGHEFKRLNEIKARIRQNKATLDQFLIIANNKLDDDYFLENPKYFRPETIFSAKHWYSYLNEDALKPKEKNDPYSMINEAKERAKKGESFL